MKIRDTCFYAKDKWGNLYQFAWLPDDTFTVRTDGELYHKANFNDYEIVHVAFLEAEL